MDAGSLQNLSEGNATGNVDEVQSINQSKLDTGSTEHPAEGNVTAKRKKKRKSVKKAKSQDEIQSVDQTEMNLLETDLTVQPLGENPMMDAGDPSVTIPEVLFQNFDVGIWSSRYRIVIRRIVNFLLGDLKCKLLFCWDMSHCTRTRFKTLENCHKPMVFKELRKIWESDNPNLPWKKGDYNESNTLLLDDSPYKALLNPSHTGIFPSSYCYLNKNDNSLGPGGDLRVYLEGLVKSDSVQKYVEQHPFGQRPINESNLSWQFYSGVLSSMSDKLIDKPPIRDVVSVKT
ncbi:UNVERIFIED_CONTAM: hypothetical protein Slati_0044600 [Sesamum latifolium]|uniref:Mitochondrial import inner membrane translocase subunit TIM50 n=1 Tax=Sesamum latifolium TaxID=2727402 RepID=A0AAW2Y730_9LAMI